MNLFYIEGRLVRAPKINETRDGKKVANITLAENGWIGKKTSNFFDVTLFYPLADRIESEFVVGREYKIRGRLACDYYVNKTGTECKKQKVYAETLQEGRMPKLIAAYNSADEIDIDF